MTDFRPFKAWRYHPEKVSWKDIIAPPYDIISGEQQQVLYERSPYNCVRLILNKEEDGDDGTVNRYTRARDFMDAWKREGILIQEQRAGFYVYRQKFSDPLSGAEKERLSVLGIFKLEDFKTGIVIPHEKTLARPKADRKKLLQTTRVNLSPIFGLCEDASGGLAALLREASAARPLYQAADGEGVDHTVWLVADEGMLKRIRGTIGSERLYIADGHHRYQTSLDYAREQRAEKNVSGDQELGCDFTLMALVSFQDPGLALFPTHRMLKGFPGWNPREALRAVEEVFEIREVTPDGLRDSLKDDCRDAPTMGLLLNGGQAYTLSLRNRERARERMPKGKSDAWYGLDVNLVGHLILAALWQIPETRWEDVLRFTHSAQEAVRAALSGEAEAVLMLKAPKVSILSDMGRSGELLPQKSTYFYPKLASGLVFYQHF